ncbi:uncharacterized protein LOC121774404 [Salvia splendens]|uniref:uncharacterized protein LOC121774404 n=1 Tax=Salvia splendens TaxID=180675 RepID=UPI001C265723|nr:uncharacterized protein LOC121774404 [Salvia splendens]
MAFKDLYSQTDHKTVKPRLQKQEELLFQHQPQLMPKKRSSNWSEPRTVMARHTQVAKLPYSINQEEIRALLKYAGARGGLIKDFAGSQILTKLPQDDVKFKYSDVCKAAFPFLKDRLMSFSIIRGPDWNHSFEVICETSNCALGEILSQKFQGKSYVVLYASKTFGQAQMNYDMTEKEMLSVVFAFEKYRQHLRGSKVVVYTNHAAIKYLSSKRRSKPHLIRWLLLLQEFEWEAVDRRRCENIEASHLRQILQKENTEAIPDKFPERHMHLIKSKFEGQRICQERRIDQSKQRSWEQLAPKRAKFAGRTNSLEESKLP